MDIVLRRAAVGLRVGRDVRHRIAERSLGRPLVIDYFTTHIRGWRFGDLRIGFEQVREVFTLITGKPDLDLYKAIGGR